MLGDKMFRKYESLKKRLGLQALRGITMLFLGILGAAAAVLYSVPWVLAIFIGITYLAEFMLIGKGVGGARFLRQASLGYTTRLVVRLALVLLVLLQISSYGVFFVALLISISAVVMRSMDVLCAGALRRARTNSIWVANLDIAYQDTEVPALLNGKEYYRSLPAEGLILAGLIGALWSSNLIGISIAGLAYGIILSIRIIQYVRKFRARKRAENADESISLASKVQDALDSLAPRLVLYFSGNAASTYQVNMWLATIERLKIPALIVLRERTVLTALSPTATPVICVPNATQLMNLSFSSVRVALYPVNVGKNIHFLRLPHIKSVFVGHGDSDKNASFNPFSRVYDEIWVAGPAGRMRYERALIGIPDESIIEVGRPQIVELATTQIKRKEAGQKTLLYAPTWEGWNEEQNYCSIEEVGLPLVKMILSKNLPIRILYRPHPFTGTRLSSVAAASREIERLLREANAQRGVQDLSPELLVSTTTAIDAEDSLLRRDLQFLTETMEDAHVALSTSWKTAMTSCMIAADAMLTDVSSVLSDFLATDKPFATANPSLLSETAFKESFPATGGGSILTPAVESAEPFLSMILGESKDIFVEERSKIRRELLGRMPANALNDFKKAVEELADAADTRLNLLNK